MEPSIITARTPVGSFEEADAAIWSVGVMTDALVLEATAAGSVNNGLNEVEVGRRTVSDGLSPVILVSSAVVVVALLMVEMLDLKLLKLWVLMSGGSLVGRGEAELELLVLVLVDVCAVDVCAVDVCARTTASKLKALLPAKGEEFDDTVPESLNPSKRYLPATESGGIVIATCPVVAPLLLT